ncbi:UDP-3-O-acyl-N-acetylglucosamine deacetylase [Bradyrhizobium sp. LHD-71]|uniref:UDP-3-O-acyl-N-acetylglucosamine deacetylase n=1 Tax=Bradyrhizobium sp. LHD-71 TaxID=3072141 RepID=UPI00280C9E83|nr:UDP-3-O-acyl-N-acetylglucosamine deacetylase [Bradyrhizobium sp. LHD-71]MDQ8727821.1 UDP-3-O-acyl-N-acetylglucosamine deacetylase [Bradyrhizobium sp. LHD-71]
MKFSRQTTLRLPVSAAGFGVHSGQPATLTLNPADANSGIVFVRTGLDGSDREISARPEAVIATDFATVLGDRNGPLVSTAEHILAALRGMGVDNAIVEVDGPEAPIMDGSAAPFVAAIDQAGIVELSAPRRYIEVLKTVQVTSGKSSGEIRPYANGFRAELEIAFDNPMIGRQAYSLDVTPQAFRKDICRARTFGCMADVAKLWSAGYARGASFENSVVVDEDRILNPEGLRYADEFVRHKVLDAIGDLALAGLPLLGAYRSVRGGHKLNHAVLCALMADRTAWRIVEAERPRRARGHVEAVGGLAAPAYGPDVS